LIQLIRLALNKFGSSVILLIGSVFYNFAILYFASSFKNQDFLYYNTVVITVLSTFYTIENTFQYHYGRILYSLLNNDSEDESFKFNSDHKSKIDFSSAISVIKIFYGFLILLLVLAFFIFYLIFPKYSGITVIYLFTGILNIASGYYSVQLISKDNIKLQHFITGIIRLSFVIISFLLVKCVIGTYYLFYLVLLVSTLFQIGLLRRNVLIEKYQNFHFSIKRDLKDIFLNISIPPLKQSFLVICGFVTFKLYLLIGHKFIAKDILNSLSLIQNLFALSLMFGGMYTVLNMNVFHNGTMNTRLFIFKRSIFFAVFVYFISLILLYIINKYFLTVFHFQTLPASFFMILSIVYFFETILGIVTTLYLYMQKIVYFNSAILSATVLLFSYSGLYLFANGNFNAELIILLPLIVQASYNYWYYPIKLHKELT
jgi:hypothetical protein